MKKTAVCRRMLQYLKEYRLRLLFALFFAAISTLFMVMAPYLIGKITTTLFDSIRDGVFYWETIPSLTASLVALYLISQFFALLQGFGMAEITAGVDVYKRQGPFYAAGIVGLNRKPDREPLAADADDLSHHIVCASQVGSLNELSIGKCVELIDVHKAAVHCCDDLERCV